MTNWFTEANNAEKKKVKIVVRSLRGLGKGRDVINKRKYVHYEKCRRKRRRKEEKKEREGKEVGRAKKREIREERMETKKEGGKKWKKKT